MRTSALRCRVRWTSHSKGPLALDRHASALVRLGIHPTQRSGVKSFVDDLALGRGVVLSRAATTLRSIETKPFD